MFVRAMHGKFGRRPEWREDKADLGEFIAPTKGLENLAQGFNP
jgi:hypothetical protein